MSIIYIATNDMNLQNNIQNILARGGYRISGSADGATLLIRELRQRRVDLLLLDTSLPGYTGQDFISIISEVVESLILVVSAWEALYSDLIKSGKINSVIVKPIIEHNILPIVESVLTANEEITCLRNQVKELNGKMESRKVIEKAKGVLMEVLNISEQEAFDKIQKESMNQSITMKRLAEMIIRNHKYFKKDK